MTAVAPAIPIDSYLFGGLFIVVVVVVAVVVVAVVIVFGVDRVVVGVGFSIRTIVEV